MELQIDFVVPVYNESLEVLRLTVADLKLVIAEHPNVSATILIVNDGSTAKYDYSPIREEGVTLITHTVNRGYGPIDHACLF